MPEEKMVTEREAVMRERAAFMVSAYLATPTSGWTAGAVTKAEAMAAERYPLPAAKRRADIIAALRSAERGAGGSVGGVIGLRVSLDAGVVDEAIRELEGLPEGDG